MDTFLNVMNTSPSRVGTHSGDQASATLLSFAKTEGVFHPKPVTTPYFNEKPGRYVYTEKGGWVDMVHFLFYAGDAYKYKTEGEEHPIGEAMQDGYAQERSDRKESSYSYEDLPSDRFGADFAVNYFDPQSDKTLSEQIHDYFDATLKPTDPQNAPNYDNLPESHKDLEGSAPSAQNTTTVPMYVKPDEKTN
jgi:filamentous hemagglutinin